MTEPRAIEQLTSGHGGAFVVRDGDKRLAEMTYSLGNDIVIIDHTDVDASLRGTGTGQRLVEAAVEWARRDHKKIMPLCPFAKSVFDKRPDYADVLVK